MIEMMIRDDSISRERSPASSSLRRYLGILLAVALVTTLVTLPSSARPPTRARAGAPAGIDATAYGARADSRGSGGPGDPSRVVPRTHTIARGETVAGVLSDFDVARQDVARLMDSVTERWDVRKAQVGSQVEVTLDPATGAVQGLAIETDDDRRVEVSRAADGYVSRVVPVDSSSVAQPVVTPNETEASDTNATNATIAVPAEPAASAASRPTVVRTETFRRGDSFDKVLARLGLASAQRARVSSRVVKQWNVRRADVGTQVSLTFEADSAAPSAVSIVESRADSPRIDVALADPPRNAGPANAEKASESPVAATRTATKSAAPNIVRAATLAKGGSIAGVLGQVGVARDDVPRVVSALNGKWNLRRAQIGTLVQVAVDPASGEASQVIVRPPQGARAIEVALPDGIRIAGAGIEDVRQSPSAKADTATAKATVAPDPLVREAVLARGETVGQLLDELGVRAADVGKVSAAIGRKWNVRTAKTGARVQMIVDRTTGRTSEVRIVRTPGTSPVVVKLATAVALESTKDAAGPTRTAAAAPAPKPSADVDGAASRAAAKADPQLAPQLSVVSGQVQTSFYQSAVSAGLDAATIGEIASIFAGEIDLKSDVDRGDRFRVLLDAPKGGARRGRVLAAEIMTGREPHRAFLVSSSDGRPEYYNDQGRTARRPFLKSPLDVTKVNSPFSMGRYHPILGYERPHLGVDLAAAPGTPIHSVGDGIVEYAGWRAGGDGRYLKVRHDATYATAFSHLSAIAPGIREGKKVKRGQVIGFTGSTGLSTGPHLHFAFLKNDQFVDPLRVSVTGGRVLTGRERREFDGLRAARLAAMGSASGAGSSQVAMAGR